MDPETLLAEAAIQTLVLLATGVIAVRLDRRSRRRSEAENAVRRVDGARPAISAWIELGPRSRLLPSIDAVFDSLHEAEIKASGYACGKRKRIRGLLSDLRAGVYACEIKWITDNAPPPDSALTKLMSKLDELTAEVLKYRRSPAEHQFDEWKRIAGVRDDHDPPPAT